MYAELADELWDGLRVMVPLETRYASQMEYRVANLTFTDQRPTPVHLPPSAHEGQKAPSTAHQAPEQSTNADHVNAPGGMLQPAGCCALRPHAGLP
jgi:hypothetical protein